jgi:nucleoside-diphosphate-sugar epimerase
LPPRIAVTGASGFVGRHLTAAAVRRGVEVTGIVRSSASAAVVEQAGGRPVIATDPGPLVSALRGASAVVHLAHIGRERPGETYEQVNVLGTARVAAAAEAAGVPRVVMFSGLGVAHYGQAPRVTNRYFLSKLGAEAQLFRPDRTAIAFRPSYIVGPGDGLIVSLLEAFEGDAVTIPGDGSYRMQPIAVSDAADAVLAAVDLVAPLSSNAPAHRVFDLVGPEPIGYRPLIARVARLAEAAGRPVRARVIEVPIADAERQAREGGFQGMGPDDIDVLLCDELAPAAPLEELLGRPLKPLAAALEDAVRGSR